MDGQSSWTTLWTVVVPIFGRRWLPWRSCSSSTRGTSTSGRRWCCGAQQCCAAARFAQFHGDRGKRLGATDGCRRPRLPPGLPSLPRAAASHRQRVLPGTFLHEGERLIDAVHRSLRENRPVGAEIVIIDHAVAHSGVHTITLARKKIVKRPVGISYR